MVTKTTNSDENRNINPREIIMDYLHMNKTQKNYLLSDEPNFSKSEYNATKGLLLARD